MTTTVSLAADTTTTTSTTNDTRMATLATSSLELPVVSIGDVTLPIFLIFENFQSEIQGLRNRGLVAEARRGWQEIDFQEKGCLTVLEFLR